MNKRNKLIIKELLNKILSNSYDTSDLELLLTHVRSYVLKESFTLELGDFINHAEGKFKGKLHDSIAYMFYRMLYFRTYQNENSPKLNQTDTLPPYFKPLLLLCLKRPGILKKIKDNLNLNKDQSKNIIENLLPQKLNGKLDQNYCSELNIKLINECLSLLDVGSEVNSESIFLDFVKNMNLLKRKLNFEFDSAHIDQNKFIIHVLDILNAKEFTIDKKIIGECSLHFERTELKESWLDSLKPDEEHLYKKYSSFGPIVLAGKVIFYDNEYLKDISISFPLIITEIDSMEYLDESLISRSKDENGKRVDSVKIPEVFTINSSNKIIELI